MNLDLLTWTLVVLLGLAIGSFLNVVIHRLPRMMAAQWAAEVAAQAPSPETAQASPPQRYNIAVPHSHCPHCGHALSWLENLPVVSYLWLKGRCQQCHAPIGWRYPAVEILCAAVFSWSFAHFGLSAQALAWAGWGAALIALAAIDADTHLLPDVITQPLVWAGLLAASLGLSQVGLSTALWGAVLGYLFLWSVYWLFKLITGKEGMGQGDFKLLAALGAWLGWPALLSVVLIASLTGVACGLWLRLRQRLPQDAQMPFGPFLALAGLWIMVWGPLPHFQV
ncbi:A24 family peptidase [Limnohabitans sp. G3-2]|uniref:prepilin peptidase n=1 Tax=Limnohabitans sp. G3-2 TaxID=1100711 RepID=UPI000C1EB464|nr:A24 family peptidase [Limnohabitans sp. G3-2]PIT74038.1 prepilin peptidase [Limnohabitans sp. G3-2]